MATVESKAAFGRRKDVNRSTVTRWEKDGLLSMTPDGLVKVEESEWLLAERPANYRGGTTKGSAPSAAKPRSVVADDESPAQAAERIVVREGRAPYDHAEAVRIKENYLALLRQLEYERESGKVVAIEDVAKAVVAQSFKIRNKILGLGSRLAARLAIMQSPEQIKALVDTEADMICQELSLAGDGDITADDLRRAV